MIPKNVIIRNYKSYGNEETEIDLSGNSVKLIYGNIGAGKTTFVDGIIWCLYGESLVNIDEVINRKNKKNCKVEFNFSIRGDDYSVVRYRKDDEFGDDLHIFKNSKNISPAKKKDSQELINSIVGMNHKAMISSVMFSSEIYISFLRVREAKRLEIFDSVLNMNIFKKWYDTARAKKAPIEEEYNTASSLIERLNFGRATLEQNIEDYRSRVKTQLVELKTAKEKLLESNEAVKKELEDLNKIDVKKELSLAEEYHKIRAFNDPIKEQLKEMEVELKETIVSAQKASLDYNTNKEKLDSLLKIDVEEEKNKIKINDKNKEIEKAIKDLESSLSSLKSTKDNSEKVKASKEKELSAIQKNLTEAKKSICFTCGQPIGSDTVEELVSKLKNDETLINEEIADYTQKIETYIAEISNLENEIEKQESLIVPVSNVFDLDELQDLTDTINKTKTDMEWQEKAVNESSEIQNNLEAKLIKLEQSLKEETAPSRYSIDFLNNLHETIQRNEKTIEKNETEIRIINEKAKGVYDKSYVEELEGKIKEIDIAVEAEEKIKKKKQEDLLYYNYLMKALSNKDYGIKKYIISKMIDEFNKNINKYIPLFFERDIRVEFDKNLKETIYENKQEISFNSFSSGEKSLLDISIAFSLYILVKNFFSSDIRFLVFDEILDRNLDTEGLQSILQVINELAKDNSIMVISHRSELQESFERRIHVYKENGFSKIEVT